MPGKKKKPMPLRVGHTRSMGQEKLLALRKGHILLPSSKVTTCTQPETSLLCVPPTVPSRAAWRSAEILSSSLVFPKDKADSGEVGFPWAH